MESERFLGNSKTSWTEEAQAVIQDVKSHVKTIQLSDKLNQVSTKIENYEISKIQHSELFLFGFIRGHLST